MSVNTVCAKSWTHLNELLFEDSWRDSIQRHRSDYAFRGVSNAKFKLTTSLIRLDKNADPNHGKTLEQLILRAFKNEAYEHTAQYCDEWYWLSLAQHHGLPTRLLDWTSSPLVALHFATAYLADSDKDGAIWCINVRHTTNMLPDEIVQVLREEYTYYFTIEMLKQTAPTLTDLDRFGQWGNPFVIFFRPPPWNARMIQQRGIFSLMPDPTIAMDDWLKDYPDIYKKIIIPSKLKWEIRNKLDQMNITERILFPGLDGLSTWLKRYYTPYPDNVENTEGLECECDPASM